MNTGDTESVYSELILDLYKNPDNEGTLNKPDLTIEGGNPLCGDLVTLYVKFNGKTIEDIKKLILFQNF